MGLCYSYAPCSWDDPKLADFNNEPSQEKKQAVQKFEQSFDPNHFFLTTEQKSAMKICWVEVISHERRDIFHKTMLFCIEASPKLNEIIAMNRYCYRDLTKWPKLNEMCQKKFDFFEKLIVNTDLSEEAVNQAVDCSGKMHASYSKYGMKPHFLDIFQQQFLGLLARLKPNDLYDRQLMIQGYTILMSYMIDRMNVAYADAVHDMRLKENHEKKSELATSEIHDLTNCSTQMVG